MDQQTDTDLDQADEEILTYTVSDETFEATGMERSAPSIFTVGSSTYSKCCYC
jgi:hypothetical protein